MVPKSQNTAQYTFLEEIFNSITHGAGLIISVVGLVLLIVFSSMYGQIGHVVSCTVFGVTLVLLYTSSTLYHSFRKPTIKHFFKIMDHSCIFALIAGTYTPFVLIVIKGALGWSIFAAVWILTILGIVFKAFFVNRFKIISTLTYILMGWLIILAIKPLFQNLPEGGIVWLVAGGLSYTSGTIFYMWKKLPFNHAIWHLFVLAGSICHFMSVFFYIVPSKA